MTHPDQRNPIQHLRDSLLVCLMSFVFMMPTAIVHADPPVDTKPSVKPAAVKEAPQDAESTNWTTLKGKWKATTFGGDGEVDLDEGLITMNYGDPITGVKWTGDLKRNNYEIELQGQRVEGFDFFCALTIPVGKDHVSLVLGGWGGGTVGISSIDDRDASDNETTMYADFDNKKWYTARVRVEDSRIAVWIDDNLKFQVPRKDRTFDIRQEMDPCLPLGLANFQCKSQIRNVRVRSLEKSELGQKLKSKKLVEQDDSDSPAEASAETPAKVDAK